MNVTVTDPDRRSRRPLAVHECLPSAMAHELRRVYIALGYAPADITVTTDTTAPPPGRGLMHKKYRTKDKAK
jgi:hypothetical protein